MKCNGLVTLEGGLEFTRIEAWRTSFSRFPLLRQTKCAWIVVNLWYGILFRRKCKKSNEIASCIVTLAVNCNFREWREERFAWFSWIPASKWPCSIHVTIERALNCSTVQRAPFIIADFKNFRRETMEGEMDGDGNRGGDNNRRQRRWRPVVIRRRSSQMSKQREFPLPFCMVSHLWHGVRRVEQTFCHNSTFHFHLLTRVMLQILKTRVK